MQICFRRFLLLACVTSALAGCGNKETKEALQKAGALEDQKQYQDANTVLLDALQARQAKIRAANPPPTDQASGDALTQKTQTDTEILKLERAQLAVYLHLERADLASVVYADILRGNPGDTVVADTLHDKDPMIRTGAVRILGLEGKPDAIPALVSASKDDDKDVRRAAVAALGSIKDPSTIDPLLAALKDSNWFVRSEAASSLALQKDPRAIKSLFDTVTDSDSSVENSAESALLLLCRVDGASAEDFASRLNDPNEKIVMISAVCLAVMHDPRAVPALVKLSASPDLTTRLQALKGLGESADPAAIPTLRQTLKDSDVNVRGWSIIGLGNLKDQESLASLQAIAADASQNPKIREAASVAINQITGQTATMPGTQ
jgi:HEAT repeat protein